MDELVRDSRARTESYRELLQRANELQMENQWEQALQQCDEAVHASANNFLAHLNSYICRYHLGQGPSLGDEIATLLYSVQGAPVSEHHQPAAFYVCAVLALLCYQATGDSVKAKSCALLIWPDLQHPIDLPGVPTCVSEDYEEEGRDVEPIITALRGILTSGACGPDDRAAIEPMIDAYRAKKRIYSQGSFRRWVSGLFSRSQYRHLTGKPH